MHARLLDRGRGLFQIVHIHRKMRDAARAGRHQLACRRLDQLQHQPAERDQRQLLLPCGRTRGHLAADLLVKRNALRHVRGVDRNMGKTFIQFLHAIILLVLFIIPQRQYDFYR